MWIKLIASILLLTLAILGYMLFKESNTNVPLNETEIELKQSTDIRITDPVDDPRPSEGATSAAEPNERTTSEWIEHSDRYPDPTPEVVSPQPQPASIPGPGSDQAPGGAGPGDAAPAAGDAGMIGLAPEASDPGIMGLAPEAGELDLDYAAPEAGDVNSLGLAPEASDPGTMGPAPEASGAGIQGPGPGEGDLGVPTTPPESQ